MQQDKENNIALTPSLSAKQPQGDKPAHSILSNGCSGLSKPLLIMNIDISPGKQDQVIIMKDDFDHIKLQA